jgi:hypothetical protein
MSGLTMQKLVLALLTLTALNGCSKWASGGAIDRLRPDAAAHAQALAGDSIADARETGLTLLSRLGALAEWD